MPEIKLHDTVAMLVDIPEKGLRRGEVGAVVEVFDQTTDHPGGYIIEFVTESGDVYAHADITDASQIVQLHFRRKAA